MGPANMKKLVDASFVALCLALFFFLVWDIWSKYASYATTVAIGFKSVDIKAVSLRAKLNNCPLFIKKFDFS